MRYVTSCSSQEEAEAFLERLSDNGIEANVQNHESTFQVWIASEDDIEKATALFSTAVPSKPRRLRIIANQSIAGEKWFVTKILIALCVIIFFLQSTQRAKENTAEERLGLSPITISMLYDYPLAFEKELDLLNASPDAKVDMAAIKGYWTGVYKVLLRYPEKTSEGPLFEKISQGELYRLISPSILHGGFLHILFNMLWLWLLGKQVEHRVGIARYLLLSLVIGVVSNTGQYLMGGFLFLGYSGIVAGLAGFIWVRQKKAPWEGYPLPRATLIFLAVFIIGMSILSMLSFLFARLQIAQFPDMLANTGHIVGALTGIACARIPVFVRSHV